MAGITGRTGAPYARIMGLGAYRPTRLVPNSEVVDAIDSSDEWIQQRSGIRTRRWAGPIPDLKGGLDEDSETPARHSGSDRRRLLRITVGTVAET